MNKYIYVVCALTILCINGCYEVKQDEKGRTIKVNKFTGDLSVIDGDKIVKLKGEKEIQSEQIAAKLFTDTKIWPAMRLEISDGVSATIKSKWNEGNIYYQIYFDKNLRKVNAYGGAGIEVQFYDDSAFVLDELSIPVSSMTGQLGPDKKLLKAWSTKVKKPCLSGSSAKCMQ